MLAFPTYGQASENFAKDIADAQNSNVDGFELALGSWSGFTYYQDRAAAMFSAVAGTNFKLFLSPDLSGDITAQDIIDMMTLYHANPNYFTDGGKPLLTTFIGETKGLDFWKTQVLAPLRTAGIDVLFIPSFNPNGLSNLATSYQSWWNQVVDGLGSWAFWVINDNPADPIADVNTWGETYASFLQSQNKRWVGRVLPYFWLGRNVGLPRWYVETNGGEGIDRQWKSIRDVQNPDWVVIQTWNDYTESYCSPADPAQMPEKAAWYNVGPLLTSHAGYARLMKYFATWFKAGTQPVANDSLYYFYRTHRKSAVAPADQQNIDQIGNPLDDIYVTAILAHPSSLLVTTDRRPNRFSLPSGLSHTRVPFAPGTNQYINLSRNGATLAAIFGPAIDNQITVYNFTGASGVAP